MMLRSERGASYIPLIIVIVLLIVAVVWAWAQTDALELAKKDLKAAQDQYAAEQARRIAVLGHLRLLADEVGFTIDATSDANMPPDFGADPTKANKFVVDMIAALESSKTRTFPTATYEVSPDGGVARTQTGDTITVQYIAKSSLPADMTLEMLVTRMNDAMDLMLNDITRLTGKIGQLQGEIATKEAAFKATIAQKDTEIANRTRDYNNLQTQASTRERDLSDQLATEQDKVRAAEESLDEEQKARREEVAKANNRILGLESDVKRLKQRKLDRETPIGPDGEILAVSEDQGLVVLNQGRDNLLRPGTTFEVYNFGKGQKISKGVITVIKVDDTIATAKIVELLNPMQPMVQGDMIASPIYKADETLHFYLLGNFRKYGKSDAAKRIASLGAMVDSQVGIDTDFLVMGAPGEDQNLRDTEAYKVAQELGITVITEDQLALFMRY